jgi:polysaccharide deacetylase family protein (PEP-CTERM system associated)
VDFEDWYQGLEIPHTRWNGFEERIAPATHRLLDLMEAQGARATFFVLGWVAERHPGLVRTIAARGHEVATHGWTHTFAYRLSPGEYRDELERSVRVLEELIGRRVLGHRAPYFSVTRQSLWVLDLLLDLGIRYDSSVHPIRNYRYGIEDAPRWPHEVSRGGHTLLEFPMSTVRVLGQNLPVSGGAYFRIYPYAWTQAAFRRINAGGRPAVFYLHPWELDPGHPRIPLPRRIAWPHYVNLAATEPRLRRLLSDFRFAPMCEVLGVG